MNKRPRSMIPGRMAGLKYPPRVRVIIERCAEEGDISVAAMIDGPKTPRAVNAKRAAARRLRENGFTLNEIGVFLHRHHTSVLHLLNSGSEPKKYEIPCPDLSGEWAI